MSDTPSVTIVDKPKDICTIKVSYEPGQTIKELKELLAKQRGLSPDDLEIVFQDMVLYNEALTQEQCGFTPENCMVVLRTADVQRTGTFPKIGFENESIEVNCGEDYPDIPARHLIQREGYKRRIEHSFNPFELYAMMPTGQIPMDYSGMHYGRPIMFQIEEMRKRLQEEERQRNLKREVWTQRKEKPDMSDYDIENISDKEEHREALIVLEFIDRVKKDVTKSVEEKAEIFSQIQAACEMPSLHYNPNVTFAPKVPPPVVKREIAKVPPVSVSASKVSSSTTKLTPPIIKSTNNTPPVVKKKVANVSPAAAPAPKSESKKPPEAPMSTKEIAIKMKADKVFFEKTLSLLKTQNPSLHNFIVGNPEKFYSLALSGQLDPPAPKQVEHKQPEEDKEAKDIKTLKELGFTEKEAKEAYMACNKDIQRAVDHLYAIKGG